jgi:drug/metabolite transporter (DMT)-like permease
MSGYDGPFIATAFVLGLVIVGAALEIERRREKNPLPVLVPTMPFILLGAAIVIASIIYFLTFIQSRYRGYFIATAALSFGLLVIAFTHWVERRRQTKIVLHRSRTTPFMFLGAILVLIGVALLVSMWRS